MFDVCTTGDTAHIDTRGGGQLEMFDVCTTGDTAHIDTIFKFLPPALQHVDCGCGNFIKVSPLVFLL